MSKLRTGSAPTAYMGVNSPNPPNVNYIPRVPTTNDYLSFTIGDIWINNSGLKLFPPVQPSAKDIYMLASVASNVARWVQLGSTLKSITGDFGGAIQGDTVNYNLNLISGIDNLDFDGNPATNTITLNSESGGPLVEGFNTDDGNFVQPDPLGEINIVGAGGVVTSGAVANTITITGVGIADEFVPDFGGAVAPAADGRLILQGTDHHIVTTGIPADNTVNWDIGDQVPTLFTGDNGIAIPANNNLNIIGAGGITVTGAGNTITITGAGGPGATIVTDFPVSGTWTKNVATLTVDAYVWSGGGGGSSGVWAGHPNPYPFYGGHGGTQGSVYVLIGEPTATFGATETITIGAGGIGGATGGLGNNGGNGGVSTLGAVIVPPAQTNGGLFASGVDGSNDIVYIGSSTTAVPGGAPGGNSGAYTGGTSQSRNYSAIINLALVPTGGGGGGGTGSSVVKGNGGNAGSENDAGGGVLISGGLGGTDPNIRSCTDGNSGIEYLGVLLGGTGGGGGRITSGGSAEFSGADGGFPGAGGGGGGAGSAAYGFGKGGNGGNGFIRIVEHL